MLALLALSALAAETYPLADAELLAIRRIESEALYLATKKSGSARARYARTAVVAHAERMERMKPAMVAAERDVEREGIDSGATFERQYPAEDARERAVAAGAAMAMLLDELSPGWRSDDRPLDVLLAEATDGERTIPLEDDIKAAREEAQALGRAINSEGADYLTRIGYQIVVLTPLAEVDPDPFKFVGLKDGARLHRTDVTLTGPAGQITVNRRGAWVSDDEIRIAGLDKSQLTLVHEGDEVVVSGPGLEIRLRGALYSGTPTSLSLDAVPGVSAEADPAVFTLFALASAADYPGAPSELRDRVRAAGNSCSTQLEQFSALAEQDHPWLGGMLARTVALGGPPSFEPDRELDGFALEHQRDDRFDTLPAVLSGFWTCARLETVWEEAKPDWITLGQQVLAASSGPLTEASGLDPSRWPRVRLVPNLLDRPTRGFSASHEDEVSVFLGPPATSRDPLDPGVVVHEALHHVVDPVVRGRPCAPADEAHAAVLETGDIATAYPDADVWLSENLVRALTIDAGIVPGGGELASVSATWAGEGFSWVPEIVSGLERESWDVWVGDRCAYE